VAEVDTDQGEVFGAGTLAQPEAVVDPRPGELLSATYAGGQPAALVMRSDLHLEPGVPRTLRFAYGYLPPGVDLGVLDRYRGPGVDPWLESAGQWQAAVAGVAVSGMPDLTGEAVWRSAQLLGSSVYLEYYGLHVIPQGSAYLYLSGGDGAPRDQALFTVPAVYLDPAAAREMLELIMKVTDAGKGDITYSFTGHGVNESAFIHHHPSDLDLFFLMALGEYLAATGDLGFLSRDVDFHPKDATALPPGAQGRTVLDHVRAAFRHLTDTVGLGSHGLIRVADGDWSDGIVYRSPYPRAILHTMQHGESVPNSEMALVVLPLMATLIDAADPGLATEMRAYADALVGPVRETFGSSWFGRAWMRDAWDRPYLAGSDGVADPRAGEVYLDLEAQPWGLLAGVLTDAEREAVLDEVEARLDDDSPIGPRLQEGGQVWPAISQLMTWAYSRYRPDAAWRSLDEHLYATHTREFPEVWMGTLSGPDGWTSSGGDDPGGTWNSFFTPMVDFPVNNMNPDAMWFLGLLRTAGLEPAGDGLSITPRRSGDTFTLDTALLRIEVDPHRIAGEYRAHNDGSIVMHVGVPAGAAPQASVGGTAVAATVSGGQVALPLTFRDGATVPFSVAW
jgi:hypothetical protein